MKHPLPFLVFLLVGLLFHDSHAQPKSGLPLQTGPGMANVKPAMAKAGGSLAQLHAEYAAFVSQGATGAAFRPKNSFLHVNSAGQVLITAVAATNASALQADLKALGLQKSSTFGRVVSGWFPIAAIHKLTAVGSLKFVRPAYPMTQVGAVTSQGDQAMRAGAARTAFGVDGTGMLIGVLSDSYGQQNDQSDPNIVTAAEDEASGDVPAVTVLDDTAQCPGLLGSVPCNDEGRGMVQLIHDVAPGAGKAFHTAFNGVAGFAHGILALRGFGADVIVDDVIYLEEPMWQDGPIAQAVDQVKADGAAYFSAAGNNARQAYDSPFRSSGIAAIQAGGDAHDFDPGPGPADVFQQITIPVGSGVIFAFQWDSPYFSVSGAPGSPNDIDICLTTEPPLFLLACGGDFNIGGDPVEIFSYGNSGLWGTTFNLVIEKFNGVQNPGPNPGRMKYVRFDVGPGVTIDEYATNSPTIYGHANAAGAEAVGAAFYQDTPEFDQTPPLLESFSAAGPTPILFDLLGNPINDIRHKPEIVAPDGTDTTFFPPLAIGGTDEEGNGFPNFFGTSAAAPHAAGVAALMLEAANTPLSPDEIYRLLEQTAIDMGPPGFDDDTGYGFVQADAAVNAARGNQCVPSPEICDDGLDNDCDELADNDDPDCNQCVPTESSETMCSDGLDNDCDTFFDDADSDCQPDECVPTATKEKGPRCSDDLDNDCDGFIDGEDSDCPNDSGNECVPTATKEKGPRCSDGLDNDCDGFIDGEDSDC